MEGNSDNGLQTCWVRERRLLVTSGFAIVRLNDHMLNFGNSIYLLVQNLADGASMPHHHKAAGQNNRLQTVTPPIQIKSTL